MAAVNKGGNWAKTMKACEDQIPWFLLDFYNYPAAPLTSWLTVKQPIRCDKNRMFYETKGCFGNLTE